MAAAATQPPAEPAGGFGAQLRAALPALLGALGLAVLLLELWRRPQDIYALPPPSYPLVALAALLLAGRRLPWLLWGFWAAAALSLLWSLAPGHTLLALQWGLVFLAFAVAGRWRPGYWLLMVPLLLGGLDRVVLFSVFDFLADGESLLLYQSGAQALLLVAPGLLLAAGPKRRWWLRLAGGLLLAVALFVALASGARAVYLPLIVILTLAAARLLRSGVPPLRLAAVAVAVAVALVGADLLVSGRPVATALERNVPGLSQNASGERQVRSVTWRLRMAEQTLTMTAAHPLGTGAGSFPALIHHYQHYPMLWSNSAHNYYLETLATAGPLGLLLLLAALGVAVVRGWSSGRWPVALGVAGYWTTLAFDVGNLSPGFMAVGWWGLGYLLATPAELPAWARPRAWLGWLGAAAGIAALAWWYAPCEGARCALERQFAFPRTLVAAWADATMTERQLLLSGAAERYPESFWVDNLRLTFAQTPEDQLAASRRVAQRFPYQHPDRYLDWARSAREVGDPAEERAALAAGLEIFHEDAWVATGRRLTRERYLERVATMRERLAALAARD